MRIYDQRALPQIMVATGLISLPPHRVEGFLTLIAQIPRVLAKE